MVHCCGPLIICNCQLSRSSVRLSIPNTMMSDSNDDQQVLVPASSNLLMNAITNEVVHSIMRSSSEVDFAYGGAKRLSSPKRRSVRGPEGGLRKIIGENLDSLDFDNRSNGSSLHKIETKSLKTASTTTMTADSRSTAGDTFSKA